MSPPLKHILYAIRNLIDKIIAKIDPPTWAPIDYVPFTNYTASNYTYSGIDFGATTDCIVFNNTFNGYSNGINIYDNW